MHCIEYNAGYKYQLKQEYRLTIPIRPTAPIRSDFIELSAEGLLVIKKGYAWDGPSGPTIDTATFMRGSLVHDALYQLMREGRLDHDRHRGAADQLLHDICIEDGMWPLRAWWVLKAVVWFGDPNADPAHNRPSTWAPDRCSNQK